MAFEVNECYNAMHDRQRREPAGYCANCGGEIYSEETLRENEGLCESCHLAALDPDPDEPEAGECCATCAKHEKCGTDPDDYCRFWEEAI